MLRLASNGDEAVEILADEQQFQLCGNREKAVRRENPVHVLWFSGGGNDVAAEDRPVRLPVKDARDATTPEQCFRKRAPPWTEWEDSSTPACLRRLAPADKSQGASLERPIEGGVA